MKDLGYGQGYRLAHYEADKVAADMRCLPDSLAGAEYYRPTEEGNERRFKERLEWLKRLREQARGPGRPHPRGGAGPRNRQSGVDNDENHCALG